MTTATMETKTPTTDAVLADIQKVRAEAQRAFAAMLDFKDTPGQWTARQKETYEERRVRLPQHIVLLASLAERLTKAVATRDALTLKRDRLRAAKAAIEQLIKDAPDAERIADARERLTEENRQRWLADSLTALQRGVGTHPNGAPMLPIPLRALLTDTCASCGHAELTWTGPLPGLEDEIAKAEQAIAAGPSSLASLRASIKPHLAELVVG